MVSSWIFMSTRALQPVAACSQLPYFQPVPSATKPAIIIVMSFSLWRHSHFDVIRYWAGHAQRYRRTKVRTDTLLHLIYKDVSWPSRHSVFLCWQVQLSQLADLDCDLTQYVDLICGKSVHIWLCCLFQLVVRETPKTNTHLAAFFSRTTWVNRHQKG